MTELWKPIPTHPDYEVSNRGRVRQGKRICKPFINKVQGTVFVYLKGSRDSTNATVARLVGQAFCPEFREHLRAGYKNGRKTNCRAENLLWRTVKEASFLPTGNKQGNSKLTWPAVRQIRASTETQKTLSQRYKVSVKTINDVIRCDTWKPQYDPQAALRA